MRITEDLISKCSQYINAIEEFHIDLWDLQIKYIENIELTRDQFGTIDLTKNEIQKVPKFPKLNKLSTLILTHNKIKSLEPGFGEDLIKLENLILMNNLLKSFETIEAILSCR